MVSVVVIALVIVALFQAADADACTNEKLKYTDCQTQCSEYYGSCTQISSGTRTINGNSESTCNCCSCSDPSSNVDTDIDTNSDSGCKSDPLTYDECSNQCTDYYGSCGGSSSVGTTCTCCNCGEDTENNGCTHSKIGAEDNPLKHNRTIVYTFLSGFWIIFVVTLSLFAFKTKAADDTKKTISDRVKAYIQFNVIDGKGKKKSLCCQYIKTEHDVLTLCYSESNRLMIWVSFAFDNILVLSCAILLASVAPAQISDNCSYSNGGNTNQTIHTQEGSGGTEFNYSDTIVIYGVKFVYGVLISYVVGTIFKTQKYKYICVAWIAVNAFLLILFSFVLRNFYDAEWNFQRYGYVVLASQAQGWMVLDFFVIIGKWMIGSCFSKGIEIVGDKDKYQPLIDDHVEMQPATQIQQPESVVHQYVPPTAQQPVLIQKPVIQQPMVHIVQPPQQIAYIQPIEPQPLPTGWSAKVDP